MQRGKTFSPVALGSLALLAALACSPGMAQLAPMSEALLLVGQHPLQGRSAYQPVIQQQGERWIAYIGHHGGHAVNPLTGRDEPNGTSILDVTDPAQPKLLHHIPGEGSGAQMARVCAGKGLRGAKPEGTYLLRTLGNEWHEVWDVSQPEQARRLARIGPVQGTHKNFWECDTGIAYLVSGVPGWRTHRMTQVFDLSDPARPVFIRNFGLDGQQPGATGAVPEGLHGAISVPHRNRVYFGHGTNANGVLQIVDRDKLLKGPKEPVRANLLAPQVGRLDLSSRYGAHTVFPLPPMRLVEYVHDRDAPRDFVLVVNESLASNCSEPRQMVWMADVTDEARPQIVSSYTVREAEGNYCQRPGRFGAHSSNESMAPAYYGKVVFVAWFNAGVRVIDVRNPYRLRELAHYLPAANANTVPLCSACPPTPQTNNVEVDERGFIYIVDRTNTGLHILKPGEELAGLLR